MPTSVDYEKAFNSLQFVGVFGCLLVLMGWLFVRLIVACMLLSTTHRLRKSASSTHRTEKMTFQHHLSLGLSREMFMVGLFEKILNCHPILNTTNTIIKVLFIFAHIKTFQNGHKQPYQVHVSSDYSLLYFHKQDNWNP